MLVIKFLFSAINPIEYVMVMVMVLVLVKVRPGLGHGHKSLRVLYGSVFQKCLVGR